MNKYSDFFKTLHDEGGPTGYLGRGTHYSILRAVVFHDAAGAALEHSQFFDFAVIWDEDHDQRIIEVIEAIYHAGLLPRFVMFGERKGQLTAIQDPVRTPLKDRLDDVPLVEKIRPFCRGVQNDDWTVIVTSFDSANNPIISDTDDRVGLYLSTLKMLWRLGLKSREDARKDESHMSVLAN